MAAQIIGTRAQLIHAPNAPVLGAGASGRNTKLEAQLQKERDERLHGFSKEMADFKNSLDMESAAYNRLLGLASMPTVDQIDAQTPLKSQFDSLYKNALEAANDRARTFGSGVFSQGRVLGNEVRQSSLGPTQQAADATIAGSTGLEYANPAVGGQSGLNPVSQSVSGGFRPDEYGDVGFMYGFNW